MGTYFDASSKPVVLKRKRPLHSASLLVTWLLKQDLRAGGVAEKSLSEQKYAQPTLDSFSGRGTCLDRTGKDKLGKGAEYIGKTS